MNWLTAAERPKFMPGTTKKAHSPVSGLTWATTVRRGVRHGQRRYAISMSSVPPSMPHVPPRPRRSAKSAATRAGKSAESHVMVSPREVHALCMLLAASSHLRYLTEPSGFTCSTAKACIARQFPAPNRLLTAAKENGPCE